MREAAIIKRLLVGRFGGQGALEWRDGFLKPSRVDELNAARDLDFVLSGCRKGRGWRDHESRNNGKQGNKERPGILLAQAQRPP